MINAGGLTLYTVFYHNLLQICTKQIIVRHRLDVKGSRSPHLFSGHHKEKFCLHAECGWGEETQRLKTFSIFNKINII